MGIDNFDNEKMIIYFILYCFLLKIVFCSLDDMCAINLGPPLHSLIIPGDLHPLEIEMLKTFT